MVYGSFNAAPFSDRRRQVRGPISAKIPTLMRVGWDPLTPNTWIYNTGPNSFEQWEPHAKFIQGLIADLVFCTPAG
eukprot:3310439-Pyramimonas_sp.AAC.1